MLILMLVANAMATLTIWESISHKTFQSTTFMVPNHEARGLGSLTFGSRPSYPTTITFDGRIQPITLDCKRGPECDCHVTLKAGGVYKGTTFSSESSYDCTSHNTLMAKKTDDPRQQVKNMRTDTDFCTVRILGHSLIDFALTGDEASKLDSCETVPLSDRNTLHRPILSDWLKESPNKHYHFTDRTIHFSVPASSDDMKVLYDITPQTTLFGQLYCFSDCSCTLQHATGQLSRTFACGKSDETTSDRYAPWYTTTVRAKACRVKVQLSVYPDYDNVEVCYSIGPVY